MHEQALQQPQLNEPQPEQTTTPERRPKVSQLKALFEGSPQQGATLPQHQADEKSRRLAELNKLCRAPGELEALTVAIAEAEAAGVFAWRLEEARVVRNHRAQALSELVEARASRSAERLRGALEGARRVGLKEDTLLDAAQGELAHLTLLEANNRALKEALSGIARVHFVQRVEILRSLVERTEAQPVSEELLQATIEALQVAEQHVVVDTCDICFDDTTVAGMVCCARTEGGGHVCGTCAVQALVRSGHCPFCRARCR